MESVNSKLRKKSSDAPPVERLTLRKEEQNKLDSWVQELNTKFDGMIRLTKSDLANFLIRHHPNQLSNDELRLIETEHFDEVRWLNWATGKIRESKKQGQTLTLNDLLEARSRQIISNDQIKKTRGRKPKSTNNDDANTAPLSEEKDSLESATAKDSINFSPLKNNQNS